MGARKKIKIPILKVKKGASVKAIYAAARKQFTAADLQRYTELEEGIPVEDILAQMEAVQRQETQKRKKKAQ